MKNIICQVKDKFLNIIINLCKLNNNHLPCECDHELSNGVKSKLLQHQQHVSRLVLLKTSTSLFFIPKFMHIDGHSAEVSVTTDVGLTRD